MRAPLSRWLVLTLVGLCAAPSWAEAGSRRRVRRGGSGSMGLAAMPLKSEEAVLAALAAAPAGGTVLLPYGAFRTAIVIDRPLTLLGHPWGTTLDATGRGRPAIEILPGVTDVVVDGVCVTGSGVEGIRVGADAARITIRRATVLGSALQGLLVGRAEDVTVDLATFENNAGGGLEVGAKGAHLTRLALRGNGASQARLAGEDVELTDATFVGGATGVSFAGLRGAAFRCAFRDVDVPARFEATSDTCTFSRADVRGARTLAIAEDGSTYDAIVENRVAGTSSDGIVLAGTWHTVARNVLADVRGGGIVGTGESLRIQENEVLRAAGDGVRLEGAGNTVDGNYLQAPTGVGVRITGDACIVALNVCQDGRAGGLSVSGLMNRVVGNRIRTVRGVGILVAGDANTLQDDWVEAATEAGIRVASGAGNRLQTNSIVRCPGRGLDDLGVDTILDRNRIE